MGGNGTLIVRDFDLDGDGDILEAAPQANIRYHENLGGANLAPPENLAPSATELFLTLIADDLDGDQDPDVAYIDVEVLLSIGWLRSEARHGAVYCGPANLNSMGSPGG